MKLFVLALGLGTVLRVVALPLGGTTDVPIFKGWSYNAAVRGVARLYDWASAPSDRALRRFNGFNAQGDHPPLVIAELGLAGRVYRWTHEGTFPDTPALTAAVKAPALVADAALALGLFLLVRRVLDPGTARWVVLAYWLNPAVIILGAVLGYTDTLFLFPVLGGVAAAVAGAPVLAGALLAAAGLTKPQAILLAPAVALALWNQPDRRRHVLLASLGAAAAAAVILAATVGFSRALVNMVLAVGAATVAIDMVSGNACNLWWIAGHALRLAESAGVAGVWSALTMRAEILSLSGAADLGLAYPRAIGLVMTLTAWGWALWTARRARDLWLTAGAGAFLVHSYFVLAAPVYENHLIAAVPLLVLAAAGRRAFVPIAVAVSAICALNLNLFYGFGLDVGYMLPRHVTGVDATVLLALANCAALVWHGQVLWWESRAAAAPAVGAVRQTASACANVNFQRSWSR